MGKQDFSFIRTAYDLGSVRHGDVDFSDSPSLTIQSAAEECDINVIIDRANRGMMIAENTATPQFGDFSEVADYQSMLNSVILAQDMFAELPARVRDRFMNDPAKLLEFVSDPSNRDEAIRLGLVPEPVVVAAPVETAVPDPAPAG